MPFFFLVFDGLRKWVLDRTVSVRTTYYDVLSLHQLILSVHNLGGCYDGEKWLWLDRKLNECLNKSFLKK